MNNPMEQKKGQVNIELKEDIAEGTYSNLAVITHSATEFVVDFVRVMPGLSKASVKSRVILTPEHAKRFWLALKDNIDNYESINGSIKTGGGDKGDLSMGFGGPTAQA